MFGARTHCFNSTGQAARELGATQAQVRTLCQTNAIAAEVTEGGQWRVPKAEVERLKRDGLPPMPRPMPAENPRTVKAPQGHPVLLAEGDLTRRIFGAMVRRLAALSLPTG